MQEFSKKNSPIKEKIIEYLNSKGISQYQFYQKTGISKGTLSNSSSFNEDGIMKVLSYYTDLNPTWLLTGQGEMLIKNEESESKNVVNESQASYESIDSQKFNIDEKEYKALQDKVKMQEEIIALQKMIIDTRQKTFLEEQKKREPAKEFGEL